MQYISVSKLTLLVKGKVLVKGNKEQVPFLVNQLNSSIPASISFISRPVTNDTTQIMKLRKRNVYCVIVRNRNVISVPLWKKSGITVIQVNSLLHAYFALAKFYSRLFLIPRIQVVGSSGKTTTKEMIGTMLKEKFITLVGRGNDNLSPGVARNLFRLRENHEAAVLETGMLESGHIRYAGKLINPTIGVVTSIHRAHVIRFGSMTKIVESKAELLDVLSPNGTLIINGEDIYCQQYPTQRFSGRIIRFGFSDNYDIWASDLQSDGFQTHFTVNYGNVQFPCVINIIGRYNVSNALAAIAVGLEMGMTPKEIEKGLARFIPVKGRLKLYKDKNGTLLIDDNFNANPDSTSLLIDELIAMAATRSIVLVIGDLERPIKSIHKYARKVHFKIGQQLAHGSFTHVMAIGIWARQYYQGAIKAGFPRDKISYYRTVNEARRRFKRLAVPGTLVVLKASTYTKLRRLRTRQFKPCT